MMILKFRSKYERAIADLDFTKRRLVEQHEEDMEQMMMLKKQLEKKVRKGWKHWLPIFSQSIEKNTNQNSLTEPFAYGPMYNETNQE